MVTAIITFFNKIVDKFNFIRLIISIFVVLALMIVPKINFLYDLMPLDTNEKIIKMFFYVILAYLGLSLINSLYERLIIRYKMKPKKFYRMYLKYAGYINVYLSNETKEYSSVSYNLKSYGCPREVIETLCENNIIEYSWSGDNYNLTNVARKKLNRFRSSFYFIAKIFKVDLNEGK